ncbi:MAG: hypothetical protein ACM31O_09700, partial [Bacteroidota bacterium]
PGAATESRRRGGQPPSGGERPVSEKIRIQRDYEPVQPTYAQSTTRVKRPSLDDMGPGTDRPVPARDRREASSGVSDIDPRTRAGAFGEKIRGPHKPTLDEMGPHAERGLPVEGPRPTKPTRTIDIPGDTAKKKHRHGRPRKTGRPGQ